MTHPGPRLIAASYPASSACSPGPYGHRVAAIRTVPPVTPVSKEGSPKASPCRGSFLLKETHSGNSSHRAAHSHCLTGELQAGLAGVQP